MRRTRDSRSCAGGQRGADPLSCGRVPICFDSRPHACARYQPQFLHELNGRESGSGPFVGRLRRKCRDAGGRAHEALSTADVTADIVMNYPKTALAAHVRIESDGDTATGSTRAAAVADRLTRQWFTAQQLMRLRFHLAPDRALGTRVAIRTPVHLKRVSVLTSCDAGSPVI